MEFNISQQHEEEMPKTPGEFLCFHLCEEHGFTAQEAVSVWFELQEYCERYVAMHKGDCLLNGVAFDGGGGIFVCLQPGDEK